MRLSGATLGEVFQRIEQQTDYMFVYKMEDVQSAGRVDVDVRQQSVADVLAHCLRGTGLTFSFKDNVIVIQRIDEEKKEEKKTLIMPHVRDGR